MLNRFLKYHTNDPSYGGFVKTTPYGRTVPMQEGEGPDYIIQDFEYNILKDREKQYGNPVEMHERIAEIWSGILNHPVTGYEVALCMTGLKLARATKNPTDPDSLIDAHGYAEIAQMFWEDTEKGNK